MIVAFDIGGTRIRAGLWQAGAMRPLGAWPTPAQDFAAFAGVLRAAVALAGPGVRGAALSLAGAVDPQDGRATVANIPALGGRRVAEDLAQALGLPVAVGNDADCFALAEARQGAGRGQRVVFGVILGTGAGGGLVIDGRLVAGAGEWGHGPVLRTEAWAEPCTQPGLAQPDRTGRPVHVPNWRCGCGQWGCPDTLAGARGIERLHRHLGGDALDSVALLERWRAGEALAGRTVAVWLDLVSGPLAMIVNALAADAVPVGGGLANAADLVAALDVEVRARILRRTGSALLVPARQTEPGLIGAAILGEELWGTDGTDRA